MDAVEKAKEDAAKLQATVQRLEAQLASVNEDLEKLTIFIEVAERYNAGETFSSTSQRKRSSGPTQKEILEKAAREILKEKRCSMSTGDLVVAVEADGITITGAKKNNVLASVLSRSDDFQNERGIGWRLREWGPADGGVSGNGGGIDEEEKDNVLRDDKPEPFQANGSGSSATDNRHDALGFSSNATSDFG